MTRMSRGKIIVEHETGSVPLSAEAPFTAKDALPAEAAATSDAADEKLNPLRDGDTFAPPSAPWVGAENAWRRGIVPPPHEEWTQYKTRLDEEEITVSDLVLTDAEVATVLSTLPPPAPADRKTPAAAQLFKYAAVAALTAVMAWAIYGVSRFENSPAAKNTVTPASAGEIAAPVMSGAATVEPQLAAAVAATETEPKMEMVMEFVMEASPVETAETTAAVVSRPAFTASKTKSFEKIPTQPNTIEAASDTLNPYTESETAAPTAVSSIPPASEPEISDEMSAELEAERDLENAFNLANPYQKAETQPTEISITALKGDELSLSRETVRNVMDGIAEKVAECGNGSEERIVMRVVVSGTTGRVQDAAAIYAPYVNTPVGNCAARAVRLAQFPKFNESEMTIKYPFEFQP